MACRSPGGCVMHVTVVHSHQHVPDLQHRHDQVDLTWVDPRSNAGSQPNPPSSSLGEKFSQRA